MAAMVSAGQGLLWEYYFACVPMVRRATEVVVRRGVEEGHHVVEKGRHVEEG